MRRPFKIAAIGAGVVLAAGAAYVARAAAEVVTGYAARVVCSTVFVAGRDPASAAEDIAFLPLVRTEVDREARAVTARVGPFARRAVHREGLGSTLVIDTTEQALRAAALPVRADDPARAALPWPAGDGDPPPQAGARLEAALDAAFAEPDPARLRRTRAVVVVHGGRIVAERYAPGFGPETPLLAWSVTKSVLAALIGIRAGEGALRLDDPAPVPAWRAPADPRGAITIDHLLRMASGLRFAERYENPLSDVDRMLFRERDAAGYAASLPLDHAPGERWAYASGTSNILAAILRRSFGGDDRAYHAFPRRALFDPIGMRSAVMETDPAGNFVASSFSWATARDWARFGLLFLRDGVWEGRRILPEGFVRYVRTPTPAAPRGRYGAHWWLNAGSPGNPADRPMPAVPADAFYAAGFQEQYVVVVPSRDAVIVRLGLASYPSSWDLERFLADVLAALES